MHEDQRTKERKINSGDIPDGENVFFRAQTASEKGEGVCLFTCLRKCAATPCDSVKSLRRTRVERDIKEAMVVHLVAKDVDRRPWRLHWGRLAGIPSYDQRQNKSNIRTVEGEADRRAIFASVLGSTTTERGIWDVCCPISNKIQSRIGFLNCCICDCGPTVLLQSQDW
jgi:hypothetical protein